jgi:hypothetical protein
LTGRDPRLEDIVHCMGRNPGRINVVTEYEGTRYWRHRSEPGKGAMRPPQVSNRWLRQSVAPMAVPTNRDWLDQFSQAGPVTTSHELARVNTDVACRADRCRSSMRRLCYGQALAPVMPEPQRRFPTPWTADKIAGGYVVRDATGQAPTYLYSRENEAEARQAKVLTADEARRIAVNIARAPRWAWAVVAESISDQRPPASSPARAARCEGASEAVSLRPRPR